MSVTLRDVAELAGVSIGTASQALNHHPSVKPETRQLVYEAAGELGYKPRRRVQTFAASDNGMSVVGILTKHDLYDITLTNPFYSHVYAGVEEECRRRGMSVMFSSIDVDEQNYPIRWPPMIKDARIDALLLVGTVLEPTVDILVNKVDVPIILIDGYAPGMALDSIVTDNIGGAKLAMEHLISLGHKNIGLIGSNLKSPTSILERREGYLQTMMAHGLDPETYLIDTPLNPTGGADGLHWLLANRPDMTAVFVCNDDTATGVYQEATAQGLKIPDDLSVVGFDNTYLAQGLAPPLTTVHVEKKWMGMLGVQALAERKLYPEKPKVTIYVETRLIVRESSAALY
jgi:LacI family transcriptional regulator